MLLIINNNKLTATSFVLMLLIVNLIDAVGVGSPYTYDSPLEMHSGQTEEVYLSLQNAEIKEGVVFIGTIIKGSEIASLDKERYEIGYNEEGVYAVLKISVPFDVSNGTNYNIIVQFSQEDSKDEGMVSIGREITRGFNVIAVDEKESAQLLSEENIESQTGGFNLIWLLIGLIVVVTAIIIVYLIRRIRMWDIIPELEQE